MIIPIFFLAIPVVRVLILEYLRVKINGTFLNNFFQDGDLSQSGMLGHMFLDSDGYIKTHDIHGVGSLRIIGINFEMIPGLIEDHEYRGKFTPCDDWALIRYEPAVPSSPKNRRSK